LFSTFGATDMWRSGHRERERERDRETSYRRSWPQWRCVLSRRREHRMWRCEWATAIIWRAAQLLYSAVRQLIAATSIHPHIRCFGQPTSRKLLTSAIYYWFYVRIIIDISYVIEHVYCILYVFYMYFICILYVFSCINNTWLKHTKYILNTYTIHE